MDVGLVSRLNGDVAHLLAVLDADEVDRPEQPAGLAYSSGKPRENAGVVVQVWTRMVALNEAEG